MALLADFVLETANSPGTGTFNLAGTSTGRRTWISAFSSGTQVFYTAHDGSSWEAGIGTVTSGSPNTLSRDTVLENSLGTTSKINFTSSVNVYCELAAPRRIWASADNTAVLMASRKVSGVAAAVATDDAAQYGQVADTLISVNGLSSTVIVIALPNATDKYRIDLRRIVTNTSGGIFLRISTDGGSTFHSGSTDYNYNFLSSQAGSFAGGHGQASFAPLSSIAVSSFSTHGEVVIDPAYQTIEGRYHSTTTVDVFNGFWNFSGTPTHVLIGNAVGSLTSGFARLVRMGF